MNRPIIYDEEQARTYDILWGWRDFVIAAGFLEQDLAGQTTGVVAGIGATASGPPSLVINLAAGRVYQNAAVDATSYGALSADSDLIMQQGIAAGQTVTLTTSGLSSGQSRWALIQAQFSQVDAIPGDDPTGGLLKYFNTADPTVPFEGPGNDGDPQNTVRRGLVTVNVIYGAPATTGAEVPPNPSAGFLGLYLVDLAFGQTTVVQNQILPAGPSVGTGVPSNYPQAPFLAGLLNSHHNGKAGQAPKIILTNGAEVQGVLPASQTGGLSTVAVTGAANTYVVGQANSNIVRSNAGAAMIDILPGPTPGVLPNTTLINILNGDATALLAVTGGPGTTIQNYAGGVVLGPGQGASFLSDGANYWPLRVPVRARLGADTSFFVSLSGNDSNTGLTSGTAWQTRQHAYNWLQANVDAGGFKIKLKLADGTYADTVIAVGPVAGQVGPVIFEGNVGTPTNVVVTSGATAFGQSGGSFLQLSSMQLGSTGADVVVLAESAECYIDKIVWGPATGHNHLTATGGGCSVTYLNTETVSGGATSHLNLLAGSTCQLGAGFASTQIGTPAFSGAYAVVSDASKLVANAGASYSGAATGVRYSVTNNGVIHVGGGASFFPGNSGGTTATGGLYV